MLKNLKINKKLLLLATTSSLTLMLSGCGNKQVFDFNKNFNVALEPNGDNISIASIISYNDYDGTQVQFVTTDGLRIVSSTHQLQLLNVNNQESLNNYINYLTDSNDQVTYCDNDTNYDKNWNKELFDFAKTFNKAIILKDDSALIVDLDTWKDYEDDKIQIRLIDGTYILTEVDNIKLVNDLDAAEGALEKYAASLCGSIDNVKYYGSQTLVKKK